MTDFEKAKNYVYTKLEKELARNLYYHGIHHTRDDVLPAAERLAGLEGVLGEDLLLLRTAALYHDIGYVETYSKNEPIAVRIASETLPVFGYSKGQIESISSIIMATQVYFLDGKLIQKPDENDILQKIICDADLDSLGRDDFFVVCDNLRRELGDYGIKKSLRKWYEDEIVFLENHNYFTKAARLLKNDVKLRNLEEIKYLLHGQEAKLAS